jgi:ABC-type nitrate/sulfonate/bicarbonate transport system substrate-binding protein
LTKGPAILLGLVLAALLAACGAGTAAPSAPGSALPLIRVAYPEMTENRLGLWLGIDRHVYEQYGLRVDAQWIASTPDTLAALLSGQIDVAQASGADLISAMSQGADLKVIGVTAETTAYQLFVKPDVTDPNQLAGKKAGVSRLGSNSYAFVKGMLQAMKVIDKVNIVATGNLGATRAAFTSNAIQAFAEAPVNLIGEDENSYRKLGDPAQLGVAAAAHLFAVNTKSLTQNRQELIDFLKGYEAAMAYAAGHPDESKQVYAAHLQKADTAFLDGSYKEFVKSPPGDGGASFDVTPTLDVIRQQIGVAAQINPAVQPDQLDPAKLIDTSLMDAVKASPDWKKIWPNGVPRE